MPYYQGAMGDPLSFRRPKWLRRAMTVPRGIRKFQPGRALGGLARSPFLGLGLRMVPGLGPAVSAAQMAGLLGDPFWGGALGTIGRAIGGFFGSKAISSAAPAITRALPRIVQAGTRIGRSPIGQATIGGAAAGAAGALIGGGFRGGGARGGRRRRLDVLNVHALNRAIRRVKGFQKLYHAVHMPRDVREAGKGTMKALGVRGRRRRG